MSAVTEAPDKLTGDGSQFYLVLEHSEAQLLLACIRAVEENIGGDPATETPETLKWLASKAIPLKLRRHIKVEPGDSCACEDESWWCEEADGAPFPYYRFESDHIHEAWDRGDVEVTGVSSSDGEVATPPAAV